MFTPTCWGWVLPSSRDWDPGSFQQSSGLQCSVLQWQRHEPSAHLPSLASLHPFNWFLISKHAISAAPFLLLPLSSPAWRLSVLLPPLLPERCCRMSLICSRTIFIPSFSCFKISLAYPIKSKPSLLELEAVLICYEFTYVAQISLFPNRNICPHHFAFLLTLCLSLKCPLPCFFPLSKHYESFQDELWFLDFP